MPPTTHATLGASGSKRWMTCPGSVRLSEGLPNPSSPYAREGTAAHELAEEWIRDDKVTSDHFEVEGEIIPVTDEMAEAVAVYVDHVNERSQGAQRHLELRMDLAPLNPPVPMFGTGDCVLWHPASAMLEVIDYKHGQGVAVDVVDNTQLLYYALAAVVTLKVRPRLIRMTIVQPRAHHPDGVIRSWEVDWDTLKGFKTDLFVAAFATQEPEAPLSPGDHCRFCLAKATCPAQANLALDNAKLTFDVIPAPGEAEPPAPVPADQLTPEEIGKILTVAGAVRDWLDAVEKHAVSTLDKGGDVPGFKLVEGRKGNTAWTDAEAAEKYLANQKLKVGERYTKKLVSPTQAAKLLKARGKALPDHLTSRSDGKPKLVPISDSRPALPASTAAFGTLPEAEPALPTAQQKGNAQ